jgi:hypothetical protein
MLSSLFSSIAGQKNANPNEEFNRIRAAGSARARFSLVYDLLSIACVGSCRQLDNADLIQVNYILAQFALQCSHKMVAICYKQSNGNQLYPRTKAPDLWVRTRTGQDLIQFLLWPASVTFAQSETES